MHTAELPEPMYVICNPLSNKFRAYECAKVLSGRKPLVQEPSSGSKSIFLYYSQTLLVQKSSFFAHKLPVLLMLQTISRQRKSLLL